MKGKDLRKEFDKALDLATRFGRDTLEKNLRARRGDQLGAVREAIGGVAAALEIEMERHLPKVLKVLPTRGRKPWER
jgi:hypothetical protein